MSTFIILLFIIPGVLIFFLGKYIVKTGYVEVLKEYNDKYKYDRDGLKNYAGKLMVFTGLSTIILSVTSFVLAIIIKSVDVKSYFLIVYVLLMIRYIIKLKFSCKKFLLSKDNK